MNDIIIPSQNRCHHYGCGAIRTFDLKDDDFRHGLKYLKQRVKQTYRLLAKKYHPDKNSGNKTSFLQVTKAYHRFLNMQYMPVTIENLEIVLDIQKGYKSTHDIILPWEQYI